MKKKNTKKMSIDAGTGRVVSESFVTKNKKNYSDNVCPCKKKEKIISIMVESAE